MLRRQRKGNCDSDGRECMEFLKHNAHHNQSYCKMWCQHSSRVLLSCILINKGWRLTPDEILIALWCYLSTPKEGGWSFSCQPTVPHWGSVVNSYYFLAPHVSGHRPSLHFQSWAHPGSELGVKGWHDPHETRQYSSSRFPNCSCHGRSRSCWWPRFQDWGEVGIRRAHGFCTLEAGSTPVLPLGSGCDPQCIPLFAFVVAWYAFLPLTIYVVWKLHNNSAFLWRGRMLGVCG